MLQRNCCHLYLTIRWAKHKYFGESETGLFQCTSCHQNYRLVKGEWMPVNAVDEILDMSAHHPLSLQNKDRP